MEQKQLYTVFVLFVATVAVVSSRSAQQGDIQKEEQEDIEKIQEIELHVITKRDASDEIQRDYPYVDGRTFRASEPLDPTEQRSDQESPMNIFQSFDTVNTIFQPDVDNSEPETTNGGQQASRNEAETDQETEAEATPDATTGTTYGAQYPYSETTVTGREAGSQQQYGYQTNRRSGSSSYRRQESPVSYETQRSYHTSGTSSGYQPSRTSQTFHSGQQGRTVAGESSQTYRHVQTGTNTYGSTGREVRGPAYDGPVYIDSNGHYIDAQGRHLDSTGRYYDISGRYADATVSRTVTYETSGTRAGYGDRSNYRPTSSGRTGSGYYDSEGRYISNIGGSSGGYYDSSGRYVYSSGGSGTVDSGASRPVDSYGGTQFYSSGSRYSTTYDPVVSRLSSDPNCPFTTTRVTINGLTCVNAVAQLGRFVCYNYERVSTECCERCLQVKNPEKVGCEYGDRSFQCQNIQPYDCYDDRNRQICCERCQQFRDQMAQSASAGCEYGDLTPRCQTVAQRPSLCYLPENQRVCCNTCTRMANTQSPDCQWGNQNQELCEPFDADRRLRLNCYVSDVREICCSTCEGLKQRIPENITGCEYGDTPVLFRTSRGVLDCGQYISMYGLDNCDNPDIINKCCYTCYRYRQHMRGRSYDRN